MASECLEEQLQEIEAMISIFDDGSERVSYSGEEKGSLDGDIVVEFEPFSKKSTLHATIGETVKRVTVSVLPSATLHFVLPVDYPTSSAPELSLECIWMSEEMLDSISALLKEQCESMAGMPVLFFCYQCVIDYVRERESELLEICVDSTPWVLSKNLTGQEVMRTIAESSEKSEDLNFEAGCYDCEICFENKMGKECVRITPCDHVFCSECVKCYVVEKTRGSHVQAILCLGDSCDSPISQAVIRNAIGEEEFNRYERILLESALGEMSDVIQCPRTFCQKTVVLSQQNPTLGICEACGLSFCALCKRTYHYPEPCKFSTIDREAIVKEWEQSSETKRQEMSRRFGGLKILQQIVDSIQTATWIEGNSKPCPKCRVSIEKNDGCNKMHCVKCDTNFCWLCNRVLDPKNPYAHFNSEGAGECTNRLFEGVNEFDDDDDEVWMIGAAVDDTSDEEEEDENDSRHSIIFTDDEDGILEEGE